MALENTGLQVESLDDLSILSLDELSVTPLGTTSIVLFPFVTVATSEYGLWDLTQYPVTYTQQED